MATAGLPALAPAGLTPAPDLSGRGEAERAQARYFQAQRQVAEDIRARLIPNEVRRQQARAAAAVEAGTFQPRFTFDEVDEAYNEAGILAARSQAALDVRRIVEETRASVESEAGFDTRAFMRASTDARRSFIQAAPEWLRAEIAPYFDAEISRHVDNIAASKREQDRRQAVERSNALLSDLGSEMEAIAARDPAFLENPRFANLLTQYEDLWAAMEASPILGIDPEVAASARANFMGKLQGRAIVGQAGALYESLGAIRAREEVERRLFDPDTPMSMGDRQAFLNLALGAINQRENERAEAHRRIGATLSILRENLGYELDVNLRAVRAGAANSPEDWTAIETEALGYLSQVEAWAAASPNDPRVLAEVAAAERMVREITAARELDAWRVGFARLSPAEQRRRLGQARLASAQGAQLSDADVLILEAAPDVIAETEKLIETDPWGFVEAAGLSPALPPLDPASDLSIRDTLAARRAYAPTVRAQTGKEPPLLRGEAEIDALAARLKDPASVAGALAAIAQGAEEDAAAVLGQIAGRDADGPALAHVGALTLASADPGLAPLVAEGIRLRAEQGTILPAGSVGTSRTRDEEGPAEILGDLAGDAFAEDPAYFAHVLDSAGAIYEVRGRAAGRDKSTFDRAVFEQAAREALGAKGDFGGVVRTGPRGARGATIVPPWIREDAFTDALRALDQLDLFDAGGGLTPLDAFGAPIPSQQLRRYRLVNVGPEQYRLVDEGGRLAQAYDATGAITIYELDLGLVRDRLRDRLPDRVR